MTKQHWREFKTCERYVTQHDGTGAYRWRHRFDWHQNAHHAGVRRGLGAGQELDWHEGLAPSHGQSGRVWPPTDE